MNTTKLISSITCMSAMLISGPSASADVTVSTGGTSNGVGLGNFAGPKGINKLVQTKASGGSITTSRARALFTKTNVILGNKVIARDNIAGDALPTHADANSVFVGVGTFRANRRGATVPNFKIDLKVHGSLRCKVGDPAVPAGNSIAGVAVDVVADGANVLSGTAIQDGSGPFTATGALTGRFSTRPNSASINRRFPINLGTLRDGQRVQFLFIGSTLVSFASDIPVEFAKADFFRTSTFDPKESKKGKMTIKAAGKFVNVAYVSVPGPVPENVLYIESSDDSVINNIDPASVRVCVPTVGYFGTPSIFAATPGAPGDIDADSIPDVKLTISQANIDQIITRSNTVIVYGLTTSGDAFTGTLVR